MNSFREFVRSWFGYTRRERRASFILLIIVILISLFRLAIPKHTVSIEMMALDIKNPAADPVLMAEQQSPVKKTGDERKFNRKIPLLDINTSDSSALVTLPGIGPVLSMRIIRYRNLLGGFWSVNQLKEIYGLPEETFVKISSRLYADTLKIRKIKINAADYREMIRHPYFRKEEVQAIIKYSKLEGFIKDIEDLYHNNILTRETLQKIKPYIDYSGQP